MFHYLVTKATLIWLPYITWLQRYNLWLHYTTGEDVRLSAYPPLLYCCSVNNYLVLRESLFPRRL